LEKIRDVPLNDRRERLERRLTAEVVAEMLRRFREEAQEQGLSPLVYHEDDMRKRIEKRVGEQVHEYFSWWNRQNALVAYRRLMRRPELLRQAGKDIFSGQELRLLNSYAPKARRPFEFSDLAPLLYLKILLDGTVREGGSSGGGGEARYDHIVVDEAQDISPLYMRVLDRYSRGSSMTVLGDLAQGIYMENGVNSWDDLLAGAPGANVRKQTIQESYRSTRQIIDYANDVLRRIGVPESRLAVPLQRTGPQPRLCGYTNRGELLADVVKTVNQQQAEGHASIAIICKTAQRCHLLAEELAGRGLNEYQLVDNPNVVYEGKVAIIPTYLTKGLEFDTVVMVDPDGTNYPADEMSARLLFVSLTRATHALFLCYVGVRSPLLDPAQRRVPLVTTYTNDTGSSDPRSIGPRVRKVSRHVTARVNPRGL
jgi:DNA helicase-2/ATP-dependent DNA helicase PcrA